MLISKWVKAEPIKTGKIQKWNRDDHFFDFQKNFFVCVSVCMSGAISTYGRNQRCKSGCLGYPRARYALKIQ